MGINMILETNNISKTFKKGNNDLVVLNDVSFSVEKKKITMIVGASGSGKSTLLHILSGLDKPDNGSVSIIGTDIFNLSQDKMAKFRNKNIGFVFQFHHLLPEFTAVENVAIPVMIAGETKSSAIKKAKLMLENFGLLERIDHKPAELSGGEQQRVAVARALVNNPKLIFADEPTGNLDSKNSKAVIDLFIELKETFNQTVLMVTHNPELVNLADTVLEMKDGAVITKSQLP